MGRYLLFALRKTLSYIKPFEVRLLSNMLYFFYDVETTGLPKKGATCPKKSEDWPHIVQIAWSNYTSAGKLLSGSNIIVKPDGYVISEEVAKIHRVTHERAMAEGRPVDEALGLVVSDIMTADVLICHNTAFDINVLGSELYRNGYKDAFEMLKSKRTICTMKETIDFCALEPKRRGAFKFPRLEELHMKLFKVGLVDAHDALVDTQYLAKCFFELVRLNEIKVRLDPRDFWFTFGKYKGLNLMEVFMDIKGRQYVSWLMKQKWFVTKHYKMARACEMLVKPTALGVGSASGTR